MSDELKALAAMTALKKMLQADGHFSICTVDDIVKAFGVVPDRDKYQTLRLLHCVSYRDMPRELLQALPGMIAECTFLADKTPTFGAPVGNAVLAAHGTNVARLRIGRG